MDQEEFKRIHSRYNKLVAERDYLAVELGRVLTETETLALRMGYQEKARIVIQTVAQDTQKNLESRVGSLVTLALAGVFPNPYGFRLEFVQKRNRSQCEIYFTKGKKRVKPMFASGGGVKDVAAFAARPAFCRMKHTRKTIVADEPFRFLHSSELQKNCSDMVNFLAKKVGFQFIIVSDQADIQGDKVFNIKKMVDWTEK